MPSAGPDPALVQRFREELERALKPSPLGGGGLGEGLDHRLGVAVSGGPDSVALLLLANAALPGRLEAATVDHGLRPEAADEARFVADLCAALGVPHAALAVTVQDEGEGIQAAARAARYAALGRWAEAKGLAAVATAHHADDQAETLIMRLARGAGLAGLAGVRANRRLGEARLVRPLLGWRKAELAGIVAAAGVTPVADPSNADARYDRTAARALLAGTGWLDPPRVARAAANLADAEEALDWAAGRLWTERARPGGDGTITLDPAGLPPELTRRLVLRALAALAAAPPRGPALARLIAALESGAVATLGGIRAEGGKTWLFALAPPRRGH